MKKIIFLFIGLVALGGIGWGGKLLMKPRVIEIWPTEGEQQTTKATSSEVETHTMQYEAPPCTTQCEVKQADGEVDQLKGEEKKTNSSVQENNSEEIKKDNVKVRLVSWGYASGRSASIDTIIIHSVYNKLGGDRYSLSKILDIFQDYGVAPHYIIERDGQVHQLVKESNTAYHAGESEMPDGRKSVNNFSIGIEVINAEDDEPKKEQYQALEKLIKEIKGRHQIKYVLGHKDIAEGRKSDPWNFDWSEVGGKKK